MPSLRAGVPTVRSPLEGLRILHLSDLHMRRLPSWGANLRALCAALRQAHADLVVFTGDMMDHPGDEDAAIRAMRAILDAIPPARLLEPLGLRAVGVMGNHDSAALDRRIEGDVPGLCVLRNRAMDFTVGDSSTPNLRLLGWSWPEDPLGSLMSATPASFAPKPPDDKPPFTITLVHMPTMIFAAADLGLPLVLAGHTHAGQIRLSPRCAPHTSSDVPSHLAGGVLRLRSTLCCISRGIGDGVMNGLRINCPWQVPLYTLRHGELPVREGTRGTDYQSEAVQVRAW